MKPLSSPASENPVASRARMLVWPREHGAWGMMFVPLVTGAGVGLLNGGTLAPLLPLSVAAFALFCLRTPAEALLGFSPIKAQSPSERRVAAKSILVFAGVALFALAILLRGGRNPYLWLIGFAAALLFSAQALVKRLGRKARMASQMLGALGLTSTAPAAYYVTTGQMDMHAAALWLANWMFAGNQIHYVQLRIHGARLVTWVEKYEVGRRFFAGQLVMVGVVAGLCAVNFLPWPAMLAFVPCFVRGTLWFFGAQQKLDVHRLGFTELGQAIAFGVLLVTAYRI